MEYLFVYDGKSWWLKLTSAEQIIDYHKQTSSRYEGAVKMYMKMKEDGKEFPDLMAGLSLKEQINLMENRDYKYLQCAVIKAQQTEGTLFDGFRFLNMEAGAAELETIRKYGAVSSIRPEDIHTGSERCSSAEGSSLYSLILRVMKSV